MLKILLQYCNINITIKKNIMKIQLLSNEFCIASMKKRNLIYFLQFIEQSHTIYIKYSNDAQENKLCRQAAVTNEYKISI